MTHAVLPNHTSRTLDLLAGVIARREARVVLSSRIAGAAVIAAGPATVFLHPDRTQLYDLIVCAGLLRKQRDVRVLRRADRLTADGAVGEEDVPGWLRETREDLEALRGRVEPAGLIVTGIVPPGLRTAGSKGGEVLEMISL